MSIHLARDGSALGIFSESEVREGLAASRFFLTDLAWREGMPAWTPLSTWPEFASFGMAPDSAPPATGPAMPAWERGASFANFFATIRDVAIDPVRTFDALPTGGIGRTLGFNYLAALPSWFCGSLVYGMLFALLGAAALMGGGAEAERLSRSLGTLGAGGIALGIAMALACFLAFLPLLNFIFAGVAHLFLLPWSPKRGYQATYRVVAYAQGAFLPFFFIPCLIYVALPWSIVATVIGFSRVHRMDWWKVALSILMVFCCLICWVWAVV